MSLKNSINKLRQAMAAYINNDDMQMSGNMQSEKQTPTVITSMDCRNCCITGRGRENVNGTYQNVWYVRCGQQPNHTMHLIVNNSTAVVDSGCSKPMCGQRTNP